MTPPDKHDELKPEPNKRNPHKHVEDAQIITALNRLADQLKSNEKGQETSDNKRERRETLTLTLVFFTVVLTGYSAFLSRCTLITTHHDSAEALSDANFYASAAISGAQRESLAALEKAHEDAFSALTAAGIESKAALQKAQDSNDTAHNALIEGQRAFVFPQTVLEACIATGCTLTPIWENSGNTPTRALNINVNRGVVPMTQRAEEYPFLISDIRKGTKTLIGPHGTIRSDGIIITPKQITDVLEGKSQYWIWGSAKYRDVFDPKVNHLTCFAYNIIPVLDNDVDQGGGKHVAAISSTYLPMLSRHNCSDDDCKGDPCEKQSAQ